MANARLLVVALIAMGSCSDAPSGAATVKIKGKEVIVEWVRGGHGRTETPAGHSRLVDSHGILVGWGGDRIQHFYSTKSGGGYDVLFLAGDGRVVERATLKEKSTEGITSTKEGSYALFLAEGWLTRHNATDVDRVELGPGVKSVEPLPTIKIGGVPLRVEVADTHQRWGRGLMHRRSMSPDDGMIFLYPREQEHHFYMLNCHYPLDIAFFDKNGLFVNVVDMKTYPDPTVDTGARADSAKDAMYIVETNNGWFKAKGLVDDAGKPTRELRLEMPAEVRPR